MKTRIHMKLGIGGLACRAGLVAVLIVLSNAATAQSFGRLFFSVDERFTLNERREDDIRVEVKSDVTRKQTDDTPAVSEVSLDGKVQRSGGESTIWVNGRPVLPGNRTPEGIRVAPTGGRGGETRFALPSGDGFNLKVGQKIQVLSGKVLDSYEARAKEGAESVFASQPTPAANDTTETPPVANRIPNQSPVLPPSSRVAPP